MLGAARLTPATGLGLRTRGELSKPAPLLTLLVDLRLRLVATVGSAGLVRLLHAVLVPPLLSARLGRNFNDLPCARLLWLLRFLGSVFAAHYLSPFIALRISR